MPKRNHEQLFDIAKRMPSDFEPWGQRSRIGDAVTQPDCSCECRFFNRLDGGAGLDWGVCVNPKSLRVLTYQNFGCLEFEQTNSEDDDLPEFQ